MHNNNNNKYLGILQPNDIKHEQMKNKITKEYAKRVKKIASSKLNSGNTIDAINDIFSVYLFYFSGVIPQLVGELMAFWIFKTLSYVVETYVVHGEVRTILLFNDHQFKRLIRGEITLNS